MFITLTPRLIDQLRAHVSALNMTLESEIANYQYRVGPGTFLMSPSGIWNSPRQPVSTAAPATPATGYSLTGTMFYPYIGKVHVVGKTLAEIRSDTGRLATYIADPQVDVNIARRCAHKRPISQVR